VAADAIDAATPEAAALGLHIQARLSPATITGDWANLDRLASNLIENAIRHNHQGGQAEIITPVRDGHATLAVTNTRPPIGPAEVPALFEPFRHGPPRPGPSSKAPSSARPSSRPSSPAHHGTIDAQAQPEEGLTPTVSFAADPDSPPACPGGMPDNQHR
jgi:light-regulated signal transduction histidine kinase (bacteriophytochrome)